MLDGVSASALERYDGAFLAGHIQIETVRPLWVGRPFQQKVDSKLVRRLPLAGIFVEIVDWRLKD